jgi:hypothetical protein
MTNRVVRVNSLRVSTTNIFHEHHYIRIVGFTEGVGPDCELGAAVYLSDRERNQVPKWSRKRSGILEYHLVHSLSSRGRIGKII